MKTRKFDNTWKDKTTYTQEQREFKISADQDLDDK